MALDAIDLAIIERLQADAKMPLAKLGEIVGLSAPTVLDRVRKLENSGVIKGYAAIVDARAVGLDVTAFVGVALNYPNHIDAIKQWVDSEPQVLECHHITGAATLLIKVRCLTTEALENLISTMRLDLGAEKTETMVVLSTTAERVAVPITAAVTDLTSARKNKHRLGAGKP